jgi:hypothetical protein
MGIVLRVARPSQHSSTKTLFRSHDQTRSVRCDADIVRRIGLRCGLEEVAVMTFNYRIGLVRAWLVLSLLWVAISQWASLSWGAAIGVPLAVAVVLYLVVWAIRRFAVKEHLPAQTFDLSELRRNLARTQADNPESYKTELEPFLDRLEAKYGNIVPTSEMGGLQQLVKEKLADIEERRQEIIKRGAKEGKTIELDSLRRTLEASKATYTGSDREAYLNEMNRLLESLTAKYGSRIPVDHAYRIMQDLEAGRGYRSDE